MFHRATRGERGNVNVLKKFTKTYLRYFNGARDIIDAVTHTRRYAEALDVLDAWPTAEGEADGGSGKIALEPIRGIMRRHHMPLGETLVKNGVVTKEQFDIAIAEQKKNPNEKIGEILLRLGYLPLEDLESSS